MQVSKGIIIALSLMLVVACDGEKLQDGPPSPGPHGPLSASDFDKDGKVTRVEIEEFMKQGPERRVGLVAYFDQFDIDKDQTLNETELAAVKPEFAFDGSDANADGAVTRDEVEEYVADRLYRQIGLEAFFDLLDTDKNDEISPEEIEAAHTKGQLPRG